MIASELASVWWLFRGVGDHAWHSVWHHATGWFSHGGCLCPFIPCYRLHFFRAAPDCVRRVFTERLPGVAIPSARRTDRLRDYALTVSLLSVRPGDHVIPALP